MKDETPTSRKFAKRIRVPVLPVEEDQIKNNAKQVGLPTAVYLRRLGLNHEIKGVIDQRAILELVKINGDLGRLGGLLKLALSQEGGLFSANKKDLHSLLADIKKTQQSMLDAVNRL